MAPSGRLLKDRRLREYIEDTPHMTLWVQELAEWGRAALQTTCQRIKCKVSLLRVFDGPTISYWRNRDDVTCICGHSRPSVSHMVFDCNDRIGENIPRPDEEWERNLLL